MAPASRAVTALRRETSLPSPHLAKKEVLGGVCSLLELGSKVQLHLRIFMGGSSVGILTQDVWHAFQPPSVCWD